MAKKPAVTKVSTQAELEGALALEPGALDNQGTVEYIAKTTMGYVNLNADQVIGKSDEELNALLDNDYLKRLGAFEVLKVTRTPVFKRAL